MSPPVILREIFQAHRAARGIEDDGYVFDDGGTVIGRLDVLVHRPTADSDLTTFTTIGMAAREMPAAPGPGDGGRAELQFARRGRLNRDDEYSIAVALANLVAHPFVTGQQLNWGHQIGLGREFPTFSRCSAVFLSGPLTNMDDGYIRTREEIVRLITVVPITEAERALGRTLPPTTFAQRLLGEVDVYAERP